MIGGRDLLIFASSGADLSHLRPSPDTQLPTLSTTRQNSCRTRHDRPLLPDRNMCVELHVWPAAVLQFLIAKFPSLPANCWPDRRSTDDFQDHAALRSATDSLRCQSEVFVLNPVARSWREALHRSGPSNMRPIRRHKVSRNATASGSNKRVTRIPSRSIRLQRHRSGSSRS
jgi:hypothetical protein